MFEIESRRGSTVLRLAHGKASALDLEFCRGLTEELSRLRQEGPAALIVTGTGGIFSAGVDLLRILEGGEPYVREFFPALENVVESFFSFPYPVVAAINGHAIAGGGVIALAADRRGMAEGKARFGLPEIRVGLPFPPSVVEVSRFALPTRFRSETLYGGGTYDPRAALARGFVDAVVPPEELMAWAEREAADLGALAPEAFRLSKELLRREALAAMRSARAERSEEILDIWSRPATLRAIEGYVERTFKSKK
jgi:enoyl-CoA hydratase